MHWCVFVGVEGVFVVAEDESVVDFFDRHAAHLKTSSPFSSYDAIEHTPLRWTIPLQIEQE